MREDFKFLWLLLLLPAKTGDYLEGDKDNNRHRLGHIVSNESNTKVRRGERIPIKIKRNYDTVIHVTRVMTYGSLEKLSCKASQLLFEII